MDTTLTFQVRFDDDADADVHGVVTMAIIIRVWVALSQELYYQLSTYQRERALEGKGERPNPNPNPFPNPLTLILA